MQHGQVHNTGGRRPLLLPPGPAAGRGGFKGAAGRESAGAEACPLLMRTLKVGLLSL